MSREAELFKDKIEVSLDGRQIFYLFFGGAVIVGLVFVLGVMVGRRVEARGHVDRARVAATVDPLAALDRLEGGTNLSFQGSLRGGETPASDVENKIAAMQKADAAPKKADARKADEPKVDAKKADVSHDEPKAEAKKSDEKSDAKQSDEKSDAKKSDEKSDAKKSDEKSDSKKSDDKVEAKKSDDKSETKKSDRSEKSDEKSETKKADESKKTADADDTRGLPASAGARPATEEKKQKYTLQLSSFQDKREAEAYLDSIKSAGYEARVTEGTVDGKQYYRVRMGSYKSVEAANDAKAEFEKGAKKSAIVTRL